MSHVSLIDVAEAMPSSAEVYVDRIFPAWCDAHGLAMAERRMVRLAVDGVVRHELAGALGVAPSTLQKHVKHVCQKAGVATLRDVVVAVLREALAGVNA